MSLTTPTPPTSEHSPDSSLHDASSLTFINEINQDSYFDHNHMNENVTSGYWLHRKVLGEGQFGKIRLVTHLRTAQHAALKIIHKKRFRNEEDRQAVENEINSLKVLKHCNIARLLQLIDTSESIYMVLEYCNNGNLLDYVEQKGKLSEAFSRRIFGDLIKCLNFMHERGISHCDIRPENVLLDNDFRIKLIGFQMSHVRFGNGFSSSQLSSIKTQYLSPEYTAPELLTNTKVSSPAIDVWSSGVLLHFLLTGQLPFTDDSLARLFKKIQTGIFTFQNELGDAVRDVIVRMLQVDPLKRANVSQILSHQWLRQGQGARPNSVDHFAESDDKLDDNALNECMELHRHEVDEDIVQLRYNILYKFCYHTATYWLIKANYDNFKKLNLNGNSMNIMIDSDRFRSKLDYPKDRKSDDGVHRRHTFMRSRVAANSLKVAVKSVKSAEDDRMSVISTPLVTANKSKKEGQPCESKKRNKLGKADASIVDLPSSGLLPRHEQKPTKDDQMWPVKVRCKSHFNLRRIFSNSQIADERSNSAKSIDLDSDGVQSDRPVLNHKSSLKKRLSRKLSFAFSSKLLGKNLSRINSASTVNESGLNVTTTTTKRVYSRSKNQSQNSLEGTTDSDEYHVARLAQAKTSRISAIDSADDNELDHADDTDGQRLSLHSSGNDVLVPLKGSDSTLDDAPIEQVDGATRASQASKINRQKAKLLSPNSTGSMAIITRYSNYEECLDEAVALLTKKGINCKADKHKLRCCVSAMNVVIVAFTLEFRTLPSLNRGSTFVTIKPKKLRGNSDDFHVIRTDLREHFERRHLNSASHLSVRK